MSCPDRSAMRVSGATLVDPSQEMDRAYSEDAMRPTSESRVAARNDRALLHRPSGPRRERTSGLPQIIRAAFLTLFVGLGLVNAAWAEKPPTLRATWQEKDARVVLFSPDGRLLVSSGGEADRLMETATGKVLAVLAKRPDRQIHGPVFSPEGRFLFALVNSDRHKPVGVLDLQVWTVVDGKVCATFPYVAEDLNVFSDGFALSRDGKLLAFIDNAERLPMLVKSGKMVMDGRFEVTTTFNASKGLPRVKIVEVPGWKERAVVDGGLPLEFSPDGAILITGSRDWHDPTARVWETAKGQPRTGFDSEGPWVKPLVFSPDGKLLVMGTCDKQVLYEPATRHRWPTVGVAATALDAPLFSTDGRLLFPGGLPGVIFRTPSRSLLCPARRSPAVHACNQLVRRSAVGCANGAPPSFGLFGVRGRSPRDRRRSGGRDSAGDYRDCRS